MSNGSVRGAGQSRAGATDTTMLIWKVIAANPGITSAEIWQRVEHGIPEGYALRRFKNSHHGQLPTEGPLSAVDLASARRWVLRNRLWEMCRNKSIECVDGDGYRTLRDINYKGNPEAIDEHGSKAAEHMALADALRTAEKWLARAQPDRPVGRSGRNGPVLGPPSRKEYEALLLVVKALRKT